MDTAKLDGLLAGLRSKSDAWARLPIARKIEYLDAGLDGTVAVAERQVAAALRAKGIAPQSPLAGEEWLAGPVVVARNLRLLLDSLRDVMAHGAPRLAPGAVRTRPDGQVVVDVFPAGWLDKVMYAGMSAEVWMEPDVTPQNLRDTMAGFYRQRDPSGAVALVLGAGNVASIGALDVVYKMFVEGRTCLLKLNPVNEYLGPFIEEAFGRLVRDGYLTLAYGGVDVGAYLCQHDLVDEIHVTGSDRTHDAIVFGVGDEGAARKARDEPINTKPITSELGNVSPVVVVPGVWSAADLRFQAENIATQMTNNAGFNCNAAKVLVTHDRWPQRAALLDALRETLRRVPQRGAYYPGADERYDRFVGAHPEAEALGMRKEGELPWTLIPGVDSAASDDLCFTSESFCGVMAETSLGGRDAAEYLGHAVRFCNETLWGTLNACIIVDPKTAAALGGVLESAIADLRYGSVAINHWPALSYALGATTWGAYPGHPRTDIQSGVGVVHNALLFGRPQKSVVRGPFRMFPKPPWFVTHRQQRRIGPQLLAFERAPGALRLPGVVLPALLG